MGATPYNFQFSFVLERLQNLERLQPLQAIEASTLNRNSETVGFTAFHELLLQLRVPQHY